MMIFKTRTMPVLLLVSCVGVPGAEKTAGRSIGEDDDFADGGEGEGEGEGQEGERQEGNHGNDAPDVCRRHPHSTCCAADPNVCPVGQQCDGTVCVASTCTAGSWVCHDGNCIPHSALCDHNRDCPDGSDEGVSYGPGGLGCYDGDGAFFCGRGSDAMIAADLVCDGSQDCLNGADELACAGSTGSGGGAPPFPCDGITCDRDLGALCVPWQYVCDDYADCYDGSDEPPDCWS
jgi:low-density lipoprotein receptor class A